MPASVSLRKRNVYVRRVSDSMLLRFQRAEEDPMITVVADGFGG